MDVVNVSVSEGGRRFEPLGHAMTSAASKSRSKSTLDPWRP